MFVLAIIPARAGSKSIKNKNIIKIKGKPLIQYTIDEAKKSKLINEIYVSSDSTKILNLAKSNKVKFVKRPKSISGDNSKTIDAVKHLAKFYKKKKGFFPDYLVILQPTSPLRKSFHIDEALLKIIKNKKADSLVSCVKVNHNYDPESLMIIKKTGYLKFKKKLRRRQEKKIYYSRNGAAIYVIKYPVYLKKIFGPKTIPFIMENKHSIDINEIEDLNELRKLIK